MGIDGNGNVIKKERDISSFNAIDIGGAFEIEIRQGESVSLILETDENLHELIVTEVRSGTLEIYTKEDVRKFEKMKLKLSGQYLNQSDTGASLAGERDFNMYGLKATLAGKGWAVFAAVDSSHGDTAMLNAWGGDPGYVSSIFSRNQYRENVDAYQIGMKYKILKNLTFIAKYTNYGQSDTLAPAKVLKVAPVGMVESQTDAYETDLVLVYKPRKDTMLKLFHANRKSEYDGAGGKDLTQAHTRFIASWNY